VSEGLSDAAYPPTKGERLRPTRCHTSAICLVWYTYKRIWLDVTQSPFDVSTAAGPQRSLPPRIILRDLLFDARRLLSPSLPPLYSLSPMLLLYLPQCRPIITGLLCRHSYFRVNFAEFYETFQQPTPRCIMRVCYEDSGVREGERVEGGREAVSATI